MARKAASEILTLPIYPDLSLEDVHHICDIIGAICEKSQPAIKHVSRSAIITA